MSPPIDTWIAQIVFGFSMKMLDELKAAPSPMPYGMQQRFKALIPGKTPDQILETTDNAFWFGYAEVLREYIALFEAAPKMAFRAKKQPQ